MEVGVGGVGAIDTHVAVGSLNLELSRSELVATAPVAQVNDCHLRPGIIGSLSIIGTLQGKLYGETLAGDAVLDVEKHIALHLVCA